jgi:hypothetical protein
MDHHTTFAVIYGAGLLLAIGLAAAAARPSRVWIRVLGLAASIGLLWFALLLATHMHYGVWQSMPDPPEEAFADGAKLVTALVAGWLPALPICGAAFLVSWLLRRRAAAEA